ncbi:hypothetical protein B0H10DRAFT_2231759 [Mycena sp. CBHHK59/15]|nr:hypothetical protein B0H10DRAFT_2231759 [Mycena sp. CBHHK59/15]
MAATAAEIMAIEIPAECAYEVKYCSLCDEYFYSKEMLRAHMQRSKRHPRCTTCNKSFLNNNSLRNHYVLSKRHHFCRVCQKQFKTSTGLNIHLEYTHLDSDDEDEVAGPDGWEDEEARRQDALLVGGEIRSRRRTSSATLVWMPPRPVWQRSCNLQKGVQRIGVVRQTCPICLAAPKKMSATRCGHVFCTSCITFVLEESRACPTCRQPGLATQLRPLDLHVYGPTKY